MEIKPNVIAMEILAYLAYETVAQVRILICHISPYMAAFSLTLSMISAYSTCCSTRDENSHEFCYDSLIIFRDLVQLCFFASSALMVVRVKVAISCNLFQLEMKPYIIFLNIEFQAHIFDV